MLSGNRKMKNHSLWSTFTGAFAALCCAGSPIALAFLTGAGFGFLINDFILFPLLFISLGFMYYSLRFNKKKHLSPMPLYVAIASTLIILGRIKPIVNRDHVKRGQRPPSLRA